MHIFRSSRDQVQVHSCSGSPVLQGECRVGQEWEGQGRDRLNLLMRSNIKTTTSGSYLGQSTTKSNLSQEQASQFSAEISPVMLNGPLSTNPPDSC